MVSEVGRGMGRVLDGGGERRREGAVLGVNLGRPIVTNGPLLRSCAAIELSFRTVSWVTQAFMC